MSAPIVRTVVAETLEDLEVQVQRAIAQGWTPIGNAVELRVGGQQQPGRAKWMWEMRRK